MDGDSLGHKPFKLVGDSSGTLPILCTTIMKWVMVTAMTDYCTT